MRYKGKNDEKDNIILQRIAEGKFQSQIANELGCNISSISYRIKKMKERNIDIEYYRRQGIISRMLQDELNKKILAYLSEYITRRDIAKKLGIAENTLYTRLQKMKDAGISITHTPNRGRLKRITNDEKDNTILTLRADGYTYPEIGKKIGLTKESVLERIQNMKNRGVEIPDRFQKLDEEIKKRLENGETPAQIRKSLGKNKDAISYRINKMLKKGKILPDPYKDLDDKIIKGLLEGLKIKKIAEILRISPNSVHYRINQMKNMGIEIPEKPSKDSKHNNSNLSNESEATILINGVTYPKEEVAKILINILRKRNATNEQMQTMADYYGVNLDSILNLLNQEDVR